MNGRKLAKKVRDHRENLLAIARETQTAYWKALSNLEESLGVEVDGTRDLMEATIKSLLEVSLCECGRRSNECTTFDDIEADHGDR